MALAEMPYYLTVRHTDSHAVKRKVDTPILVRQVAVDGVEARFVHAGGAQSAGNGLDQLGREEGQGGAGVEEDGHAGVAPGPAGSARGGVRDGFQAHPVPGHAVGGLVGRDDGQTGQGAPVLGRVDAAKDHDAAVLVLAAEGDAEGLGGDQALRHHLVDDVGVVGVDALAVTQAHDAGKLVLGPAIRDSEADLLELGVVRQGHVIDVVRDIGAAHAIGQLATLARVTRG